MGDTGNDNKTPLDTDSFQVGHLLRYEDAFLSNPDPLLPSFNKSMSSPELNPRKDPTPDWNDLKQFLSNQFTAQNNALIECTTASKKATESLLETREDLQLSKAETRNHRFDLENHLKNPINHLRNAHKVETQETISTFESNINQEI
uniref:Uncharacterized protein n=1 Tax=Clastoptera arizonana TaxID=38151 RepID=A0A1B6C823_9HEMI